MLCLHIQFPVSLTITTLTYNPQFSLLIIYHHTLTVVHSQEIMVVSIPKYCGKFSFLFYALFFDCNVFGVSSGIAFATLLSPVLLNYYEINMGLID